MGLVIFLIAFGPIMYWVISGKIENRRIEKSDYFPKTDDVIIRILQGNPYFIALTAPGRLKFIKRVRYLSFNLSFVGMGKLEVTDEMRIRISASIVQITFGHLYYKVFDFKTIRIYPDVFYSARVGGNVKGLTASSLISLSWPDFEKGYDVPDDNYNLGLHEVSHALHLAASARKDSKHVFSEHFNHWSEHSMTEFEELKRNKESSFLRAYGATNFHEFFAICIEHFFESPSEFKRQMPALYKRTVVLLNQDPLEDRRDYQPNFSLAQTAELKEVFGKKPYAFNHVDMDVTWIMIGLFMAFIVINTITENSILNYRDKILAVLALSIPAFFFYPRFKRKKRFNHLLTFVLFAIFGIGANFFAILLMVDYFGPATLHQDNYKVVRIVERGSEGVVFELEDDAFRHYRDVRTIKTWFKGNPQSLKITYRKGFLGIKEITVRKLTFSPNDDLNSDF